MSSLSTFSIWDWLSVIGPTLVVMGLAGELWLVYENSPFNPSRPAGLSVRHFRIEKASVVLVGLGVAIELVTVPHALLETAELKDRTTKVEFTNNLLWNTNLVLREKVSTLELKAADRSITPQQITNFITFLKNSPKGPVNVGTSSMTGDTPKYEQQIVELLTKAGFSVPNQTHFAGPNFVPRTGTSILIFIDDTTNAPTYAGNLQSAFKYVGIDVPAYTSQNAHAFGLGRPVKSHEVLVLVTDKP